MMDLVYGLRVNELDEKYWTELDVWKKVGNAHQVISGRVR